MRLTVVHETCYRYESPVVQSTLMLRLTPPSVPGQQVVAWRLQAVNELVALGQDGFGNHMHMLTIQGEHAQVCVKAFGTVDTDDLPIRSGDSLSPLLFLRPTALTEPGPALRDFALRFEGRTRSPGRLRDMSAAIHEQLLPPARSGSRVASVSDAWDSGLGGSAEQTQVMLSVCRLLALPARYVSGYVFHDARAGLQVSSHAWAEVWFADAWHSVDVALQCPAGPRHVRLAIGQDALDACPMRSIGQGSLHGRSVLPVAGRGEESLAQVMVMQQQQQ